MSGASAEGLWTWIKVRLRLLVSAALLTKTDAIDFLLVLSLNCTNRRFPTLPQRHFYHSHASHHRNKICSVNAQYSHDQMWSMAILSCLCSKFMSVWHVSSHCLSINTDFFNSGVKTWSIGFIHFQQKSGTCMIHCLRHLCYLSSYLALPLLLRVIIWVSRWIPPDINPQWQTRTIKYGLIMQVLLNAQTHTTWSIRERGKDVTAIVVLDTLSLLVFLFVSVWAPGRGGRCRGWAIFSRLFRSSHLLWSTVRRAVPWRWET